MSSINMAKKTRRHASRYERDQLGCMWGFIRMFNFRHGRSAHKLLVDRRHGSKRVSASGNLRNKLDKSTYHNKNSQENHDGEERNVTIAVIKPSVKKLIEEELFVDKETRKEMNNGEAGQLSDSELEGHRRKNQRRKNKTRKKSCDNLSHINATDNAEPAVHQSNQQRHHRFMRSLDIDNMIEEFCCEIHRRNTSRVKQGQLNQKHEDYKQRLRELVKFLISQKLLHGNRPREDSEILTSKDLMEVFQILGSDEELFLKLLQDPDLLVPGDVQDLQNFQRENEEEENPVAVEKSSISEQSIAIAGRKQCSFFRRKNKPLERANQNECEESDHIVILKPGPASLLSPEIGDSYGPSQDYHSMRNKTQNERISSHFFLSEIKRKLKHAIKKEQRGLSGDVERFPKSVPTKDHFFIEKMARPSMAEKKREKNIQLKSRGISQGHEEDGTKRRLSNIYIEAKKHLSEMLNNGDIDLNLTSKRDPRTLGRILSLPEYSSPLGSPGIKQELSCSTAHRRSASADFPSVEEKKKESRLSPLEHATDNADAQPCVLGDKFNNSIGPLQLTPSGPVEENVDEEDGACNGDEISSADDVETVKEIEIIPKEENRMSDASSDQRSSSISVSNQVVNDVVVYDEENDGKVLKQNSLQENEPALSSSVGSPTHSFTKTVECQLGASDLPEWSSPVSVLEPLFIEEDISPARIRSHSGEAQIQPLCIQFEEKDSSAEKQGNHAKSTTNDKELVFAYVKAVLDALNSDWDELHLKSLSSDQLLEPTLMSNVPFFPNRLCSDHELLFDCINEVLLEFCSEQCGCSPWVSYVKHKTKSVSSIKSIIHDVQEGVYWNLLLLPLPRSLDQIVRKDMAKARNWLDLRYDVDCIGTDTGELILDELIDEYIFGCLNTIAEMDECFPAPTEFKDDESILSM